MVPVLLAETWPQEVGVGDPHTHPQVYGMGVDPKAASGLGKGSEIKVVGPAGLLYLPEAGFC